MSLRLRSSSIDAASRGVPACAAVVAATDAVFNTVTAGFGVGGKLAWPFALGVLAGVLLVEG